MSKLIKILSFLCKFLVFPKYVLFKKTFYIRFQCAFILKRNNINKFKSVLNSGFSFNMTKLRTIVFGIIFLVGIISAFAQTCITPNSGSNGVCKLLGQCNQLKNTLTRRFNLPARYSWNKIHSKEITKFLKKYAVQCKKQRRKVS